jgi:tetratricopeptide (TPR) repeat protein
MELMMSLSLLVTLVLVSQAGTPQQLCFKDLYDIMNKSKLTYSISDLKQPVKDTSAEPELISVDSKIKETTHGLEVSSYTRTKEAEDLLETLEQYYKIKDNEKVRGLCFRMLSIDSSDSKILAYLGETYIKEKDYITGMQWENKAIEASRNNWVAHVMLGTCYVVLADTNATYRDSCLKEFATAMILNRGNAFLEQTYLSVCRKYKKEYKQWKFIPQCEIWKEKKTIHIETEPNWMCYAVAKAVRTYEPGYIYHKEKKSTFEANTAIENELLMNLGTACSAEITDPSSTALTPKEGITDPAITTLFKALNNKMVNEYMIYELWTPHWPIYAHCLSKESFDKLVQYVLSIRTVDTQ